MCGEQCKTGMSLAVDHDHATGKVRGLLCYRHNRALGGFSDDPKLLRAAAEYIDQHKLAGPETVTPCKSQSA